MQDPSHINPMVLENQSIGLKHYFALQKQEIPVSLYETHMQFPVSVPSELVA